MIVKSGEKILTICDVPSEDDAFRYVVKYPEYVEVLLTITPNRNEEIHYG